MAHNLFNASLYTNIFKFEDVYIGMLAKRLQTKFVSLSSFYSNVKFIFSSKFKVKNKLFFYDCNLNDFKSSWYHLNLIIKNSNSDINDGNRSILKIILIFLIFVVSSWILFFICNKHFK